MKVNFKKATRTLMAIAAVLSLTALPASGANFVVNNVDAPGIGFNDPTPRSPVGGNPGTTIGKQRQIAFQFAADLWGAVVDSPVDVVVQGTFQPLGCSPTSGTLGAAGTIQIFAFSDAPAPIETFTWYHSALINSLAGFDLTPGPPDPGLLVDPFNDDIVAFFNGAIGVDPDCLTGLDWYYGLDNQPAANEIDLLNVLMHEFAHGLGFSEFANEGTGEFFSGLPSVYAKRMYDTSQRLFWDQMTDAERLDSQVNSGNLVWAGADVTAAAPSVLGPHPTVKVKGIRKNFLSSPAGFGEPYFHRTCPDTGGTKIVGKLRVAQDGVGESTDACEPIKNGLEGRVALVDRGGCAFTTKVANAQAAGAKGVIVANSGPGFFAMGGSDPTIVIPSVMVSFNDGDTLKGMNGQKTSFACSTRLLSGATNKGLVRLYAPNPVAPGSSKSHFDTSATPNLLMEPFINSDLEGATNLDLTPFLFADIGWALLP